MTAPANQASGSGAAAPAQSAGQLSQVITSVKDCLRDEMQSLKREVSQEREAALEGPLHFSCLAIVPSKSFPHDNHKWMNSWPHYFSYSILGDNFPPILWQLVKSRPRDS